jgi:hypothetical protein
MLTLPVRREKEVVHDEVIKMISLAMMGLVEDKKIYVLHLKLTMD